MSPIQQIYDDASRRRASIASALERDQAEREPINPRSKRGEVLDMMRVMLDSARGADRQFSDQESADWNTLEQRADDLDREITIRDRELDAEAAAVWGRPCPVDGSWRNAAGDKVAVLGPSERFSNLAGNRAPSVGLGQLLQGMALGTNDPTVRASLSEGSDAAGGVTVAHEVLTQIIDAMRARQTAVRAGARTIMLDTERTTIARVDTDPQATWRLENAAVNESEPVFSAVTFKAKSLAVLVRMSRELLADSVNLETAVTGALAGAMAVTLDGAALFGSGTDPEPLGVFDTPNIGEVDSGADGAALTDYDPFVALTQQLAEANAQPASAFIMAPRTAAELAKLKASDNQPLQKPAALADIPMYTTTTVPVDQSHGTATDATTVLSGDFSQLLFGLRSQLRIELLRETFASNLQFAFLAHMRADIQLAHPASFARLVGVIPA